jgi:hypothetical protein
MIKNVGRNLLFKGVVFDQRIIFFNSSEKQEKSQTCVQQQPLFTGSKIGINKVDGCDPTLWDKFGFYQFKTESWQSRTNQHF